MHLERYQASRTIQSRSFIGSSSHRISFHVANAEDFAFRSSNSRSNVRSFAWTAVYKPGQRKYHIQNQVDGDESLEDEHKKNGRYLK